MHQPMVAAAHPSFAPTVAPKRSEKLSTRNLRERRHALSALPTPERCASRSGVNPAADPSRCYACEAGRQVAPPARRDRAVVGQAPAASAGRGQNRQNIGPSPNPEQITEADCFIW